MSPRSTQRRPDERLATLARANRPLSARRLPRVQLGHATKPRLNIRKLSDGDVRALRVHERRRERQIGDRDAGPDNVRLTLEALVEHSAEATEVTERFVDLTRVGLAHAQH